MITAWQPVEKGHLSVIWRAALSLLLPNMAELPHVPVNHQDNATSIAALGQSHTRPELGSA